MSMKRTFLFLVIVFVYTFQSMGKDIHQLLKESALPLVRIQTVNDEWPTCERAKRPEGCAGEGMTNATKVPGRVSIELGDSILYDSGDYSEEEGMESGMIIRIRGNASTHHTPLPYKIKLNKKADLLLRGEEKVYADKSWLLLKDGNLRKNIGFKVSELMNLQWTPSFRYVNVVFNGEYLGVYMLIESVKRNKNCRLNVDKTGFIFEYDVFWWNEELYVKSQIKDKEFMHYTFKYPDLEEFTDEKLSYFKQMIRDVENSLSDGTYPDFIDTDSFASWMLGHDILGNGDGIGSNIFLTKKDDTPESKVMMANLWDCEHIFETYDDWDEAHGMFYYQYLFNTKKNDSFVKVYLTRWREVSPTIFDELNAYLDDFASSETAQAIDELMPYNNERSDRQYGPVSQYVKEAKTWFEQRKKWLSRAMEKMTATGMESVANTEDGVKDTPWYNIHGQKVSPIRRGIYIQQGKKVVRK